MGSFFSNCCKGGPADELAFEKGSKSYQQYNATHRFEDLHNAIRSYQECLDLRLDMRKDLAARGKPESRDFSDKIVNAYLNLTIALLLQYERQPTPTNLHYLARVEPKLLTEWGTRTEHPTNYATIIYNSATAYNRAYLQAISKPPPSTLDPPNNTSTISPEQLFSRACARFAQILTVQNGVAGMTSSTRGKALSGLANLELLQYQRSRSASDIGDIHALNNAISHFKEASQSFSILPGDSLLLRECLDNLATAYYKRFEVDPARNHQDLNNSILYYQYVRPQYHTQHDDAEKTAWIKCSHHLAMALYRRYEPSQPHTHPGRQQQDYLTASNVDLPANTAALEDLRKAREVETEAKNVLNALGENEISTLRLDGIKRDVDNLWGVLAEHSAHATARSSRQPSPTPSSKTH
ncbi:hypothetical protein D9613_011635 [Agrocybe pediades]|uniref:Uncharacterized protein n=1 Tax=Agrocybe pediades TaxID=84607 RepID=A0A8H4QWH5_9AGAR|nr:hypothetical protein D9613_011635 [Agrocybe pediades]